MQSVTLVTGNLFVCLNSSKVTTPYRNFGNFERVRLYRGIVYIRREENRGMLSRDDGLKSIARMKNDLPYP